MEQPNQEIGTKWELVQYRLETARNDFYIASKEESEQQISVAVEFIDLAEKYCMEQLQERKMTEWFLYVIPSVPPARKPESGWRSME